jgi:hypothetical protein
MSKDTKKQKTFRKLMRRRKAALAATLVHVMSNPLSMAFPITADIDEMLELYDMNARGASVEEIKARAKEMGVDLI